MDNYVFGVDIGGTAVKIGVFSDEGELIEKWDIPTVVAEDDDGVILRDITVAIKAKQAEMDISDYNILGVGLGVPGPVLPDGTVKRCVNLNWGVFNVEEAMSEYCGFPVKAGNDSDVAALGEQLYGGGRGYKSVVMITLGTGVGGGVVLGGRIIAGAFGAAGEIGHMHVRDGETDVCGCGARGCLEQYASTRGIKRLAGRYLEAHPYANTPLGQEMEVSGINIFKAAREGDEACLGIVAEYFDVLGRGLANVSAVIDPEAYIIGGGVSNEGKYLVDGIAKAFRQHCFHASAETKFLRAELGNDAGIYGACGMILNKRSGL